MGFFVVDLNKQSVWLGSANFSTKKKEQDRVGIIYECIAARGTLVLKLFGLVVVAQRDFVLHIELERKWQRAGLQCRRASRKKLPRLTLEIGSKVRSDAALHCGFIPEVLTLHPCEY